MDNFLLFQVTQHHLLQQIEGNEWTHIDFIHSQQLVINEISYGMKWKMNTIIWLLKLILNRNTKEIKLEGGSYEIECAGFFNLLNNNKP